MKNIRDYTYVKGKMWRGYSPHVSIVPVHSHMSHVHLFLSYRSPTTLDAVAFAHIAIVWRAPPLPNNKLKLHLNGFENLIAFCSRILQRYFPYNPEGTLK